MVIPSSPPQIRVPKPSAKNNPPMASEAAPIQAKNRGDKENGNPNFATSSGNHPATCSSPISSVVDHGIPNLEDPNSKQSNRPPMIRGIAIAIFFQIEDMFCDTSILTMNFFIPICFIS